jgi:proteasome accessory factor A
MLDHLFSSLDEERGLYSQVAASGGSDLLVGEETILRHETEPPDDTRAYARAMLLRAAGAERVDHVDWDVVRVVRRTRDAARRIARVDLPDPRRGTRAEVGHLFDGAHDLEEILHAMGARLESATATFTAASRTD